MKDKNNLSLQEWIPFEKIMDGGIIKLKNNDYIKIIKIIPINYNLKSDLEKKGILNSYKTFLKTCSFDIQILIQSNKEDLSNHISKIQKKVNSENNLNLKNISEKYINFINKLNYEKKSSSKNFYIIIKNKNKQKTEELNILELNENYFKIKECLARCGNNVTQINKKEELINILYSFLNTKLFNCNFNVFDV